jgi:hypothetical protein
MRKQSVNSKTVEDSSDDEDSGSKKCQDILSAGAIKKILSHEPLDCPVRVQLHSFDVALGAYPTSDSCMISDGETMIRPTPFALIGSFAEHAIVELLKWHFESENLLLIDEVVPWELFKPWANPGKLLGSPVEVEVPRREIVPKVAKAVGDRHSCDVCGHSMQVLAGSPCGCDRCHEMRPAGVRLRCDDCGFDTCAVCAPLPTPPTVPLLTPGGLDRLLRGLPPQGGVVVQLHDINHISDGHLSIEPEWEIPQVLGEGKFVDFAIAHVKRVRGGPCVLGGKWLIVEEIALSGENPGRLLGSPTPVICAECRTDDPSSFLCATCNATQSMVCGLSVYDCARCGKRCETVQHFQCAGCRTDACLKCALYRPRVTRHVIEKLMKGEHPIKPRVQLLSDGVISDTATLLLPFWSDTAKTPSEKFAVIKLKRWHLGSCPLGESWLIIDEIEVTGKLPKRQMGNPKPWAVPGLTAGALSSITSGAHPAGFVARVAQVRPELQLFDGTTLLTVDSKAVTKLAVGANIRVMKYDFAATLVILQCEVC